MKKYINIFLLVGIAAVTCGLVSCKDYLDKEADSIISEDDAYKNFRNFQGFTEELYHCIPDIAKGYWTNSFNWGEDELFDVGADYHMCYKIDQGNFWGWQSEFDGWQAGFMDRRMGPQIYLGERGEKSLWPWAWYGIRKTNLGLANMDKLTDATTEERNLIKGQLLFFRGWFHHVLMQYFGGLPYIDKALDPSDIYPRLNYHDAADKAAQDFREAADLLPINWDETNAGKSTYGKNQLRITKIMALGYLGKNYLWAASPLMNYESTGSRTYNEELCTKAAAAFAELLYLVESGQTQYALVEFDKYSSIFYTNGQNFRMPGSTEALFRGPQYDPNSANWGLSKQYFPGVIGESNVICMPTANYVNYYGMANGLPIDDTQDSGYDPEYPWRDRDPRFYHDIGYDGRKYVSGDPDIEANRYANLYTGGSYRDVTSGSRTGYLLTKFVPVTANRFDKHWEWQFGNTIHLSWMRLADVYLMYAEAAANAQRSPNGKVEYKDFKKSALDAVNVIRARAGVDPVHSKNSASLDRFMSELRRERAVELAYEGHRFNDLRRWLLLTERPYTFKTAVEFNRAPAADGGFDPGKTKDPSKCKVYNLREVVILEREFSSRHYWLPLKNADTNMYIELGQNPGW